MSDFKASIDSYFRITERGSTIGTELRGGLITFLSMVYILIVNPNILGTPAGLAGYTTAELFSLIP